VSTLQTSTSQIRASASPVVRKTDDQAEFEPCFLRALPARHFASDPSRGETATTSPSSAPWLQTANLPSLFLDYRTCWP